MGLTAEKSRMKRLRFLSPPECVWGVYVRYVSAGRGAVPLLEKGAILPIPSPLHYHHPVHSLAASSCNMTLTSRFPRCSSPAAE